MYLIKTFKTPSSKVFGSIWQKKISGYSYNLEILDSNGNTLYDQNVEDSFENAEEIMHSLMFAASQEVSYNSVEY